MHINFISTPSHKQQKNIRHWYIITCSSLITVITTLSYITIQQTYQWYNLKKTIRAEALLKNNARVFVAKRAQLSQEKAALLKKTEEWEKYTHRAKKPSDILQALKKQTNTNDITTLRITHKKIQMSLTVQSTNDGIIIAQKLSTMTLFQDVMITSLQTDNQQNKNIINLEADIVT